MSNEAVHPGPARRRPQVLDTALDIAVREGLDAVTVSAVAERMRVAPAVVSDEFTDRFRLVEALCRREEQYFVGELLATLPYGGLGDDESALAGSLSSLLRLSAARPQSWLFLTGVAEPLLLARADRGEVVIKQRCATLLEASMREWGSTRIERKLPELVEQWLTAGETAVSTLLTGPDDVTPEGLGHRIGGDVYRMLRQA